MSHDIEQLRALEKRLSEIKGSGRDAEISLYRISGAIDEAHCRDWCRMDGRTDLTREQYIRAWAPQYLSSLDAAVALAERLLPGWGYFMRKDEQGCNSALLYPEAMRVTPGAGQHPTSQAIALCLATVRALIAGAA